MKTKVVFCCLFFCFVIQGVAAKKTIDRKRRAKLAITVWGVKSCKGKIVIALFDKAKGFPKKTSYYKRIVIDAKRKKVKGIFLNLPFGHYAVAVYHDINQNKKLDRNFFGLPIEAYGFSQNARGSFGPPSFAKAAFAVTKKSVSISLRIK